MNNSLKLAFAIAGLTSMASISHAVQMHGWDFSTLDPYGPGADWSSVPANFGSIGTGMIWTTGFEQLDSVNGSNEASFQVTTNDGTAVGTSGTAFSQSTDDPAALAFFNQGVNGKSFVIQFSTVGFTDITLGMAARANTQAANNNSWSYSVNGTDYVSIPGVDNYSGVVGNYVSRSFDLSSIDAIENQSTVYLKYTLNGSTATGPNPESAFAIDNVQINAIPEPATYAAILGVCVITLALHRRRKA